MRLSVRLLRLIGPATIVSVAYIDPGNWGSNIAAGSHFGYQLLWVAWISGLFAILFQYIAGLLGIKEGGLLDLFELRLKRFKPLLAPPLFTVVFATDMAEYMGLVVALHLLLGLPLIYAAFLAFFDVVLLALLADRRDPFAKAIGTMVAIVALSFIVELYIVKPDWEKVVFHSVVPLLSPEAVLVAAAIIGATIMPHAVALHSHVVKGMAVSHHRAQTVANLLGVTVINAAMQILAAVALFGKNVDLGEVPAVLEPLYGPLAALLFSFGLLFASLSSSAVSVEFGVLTFRYVTRRQIKSWKARLIARGVNLVPATVAIAAGSNPLDVLVYSQYVLSLVLPLVMIFTTAWTWRYFKKWTKIAASAGIIFVIAVNTYSIISGGI